MQPGRTWRERLSSDTALLGWMALFTLLLHFYFNRYYGYQRDELYFIACGEHLAFGYVDVGPLAMWLGRLGREIFGESLFALRFFSAVAASACVILSGLTARALGGGRFAQCLAALTYIVAPAYLMCGNILSLPSFEPLFWLLCAYLLIRIFQAGVDQGEGRLWIAFGVVAGIGLLNKPSMAFLGIGLVIGLLLTPQRAHFARPWIWIGGVVALVIVSPFLYWQATHGWATFEFLIGMNARVMSRIPASAFLAGQVLYYHPLNVPIWLAGLWFYLRSKDGKPYRPLGWIYVVVFLMLLIGKSKIYYLGAAYPMLLAAGALVVERAASKPRRGWMKAAIPTALVAGGLATAPLALPILPIGKLDAYVAAATGGTLKNVYEITGTFHDMFGWENQAATVAQVFHTLTPEEQAQCVVFGANFGRAGAIDFYGKALGLPPAACGHQNYYFWGPPKAFGPVTLVVGSSVDELKHVFAEVEQAATITCPETVPYEQNVPVFVCRRPIITPEALWAMLRPRAFSNG